MLHIAAFQQMGYRFTPTFVQNLLAKYDSRTRRLTLDNFIVACVQIKRLTGNIKFVTACLTIFLIHVIP